LANTFRKVGAVSLPIFHSKEFPMTTDRERLVALLNALDASPRCLERPNCRGWIGDWQITGKHGQAMTDGDAYLLYAQATPRRWDQHQAVAGIL
jgi:hypothetical protein